MKYRNILILGAAGQIARKLTTKLLLESFKDAEVSREAVV